MRWPVTNTYYKYMKAYRQRTLHHDLMNLNLHELPVSERPDGIPVTYVAVSLAKIAKTISHWFVFPISVQLRQVVQVSVGVRPISKWSPQLQPRLDDPPHILLNKCAAGLNSRLCRGTDRQTYLKSSVHSALCTPVTSNWIFVDWRLLFPPVSMFVRSDFMFAFNCGTHHEALLVTFPDVASS